MMMLILMVLQTLVIWNACIVEEASTHPFAMFIRLLLCCGWRAFEHSHHMTKSCTCKQKDIRKPSCPLSGELDELAVRNACIPTNCVHINTPSQVCTWMLPQRLGFVSTKVEHSCNAISLSLIFCITGRRHGRPFLVLSSTKVAQSICFQFLNSFVGLENVTNVQPIHRNNTLKSKIWIPCKQTNTMSSLHVHTSLRLDRHEKLTAKLKHWHNASSLSLIFCITERRHGNHFGVCAAQKLHNELVFSFSLVCGFGVCCECSTHLQKQQMEKQ